LWIQVLLNSHKFEPFLLLLLCIHKLSRVGINIIWYAIDKRVWPWRQPLL